MDIVGDDVRTASGLWPSDHAGVVATLGIHVRPLAKAQVAAASRKTEVIGWLTGELSSALKKSKSFESLILSWANA
jgi:hypothetical protein